MRIASLLASGTEIAALLGRADDLVGISHECDFPPSIRDLPVLTGSYIDHRARSDVIHRQVQERVLMALSLYKVDNDLVAKLQPDVIITQEQCDVCAVTFDDVKEAICNLLQKPVKIVSLNPTSLSEIFEDVRRVARAIDASPEPLIETMNAAIADVKSKTSAIGNKPRVAIVEWIDPIFVGANWMPELIEIAGGESVFGTSGEKSFVIEPSTLAEANPDVIIVAPCGFKLPQTKRDLPLLASKPEWQSLDAVRNGRAYLADGNAYFNRSSPRLLTECLPMLAGLIHFGSGLFEAELARAKQNGMWEVYDNSIINRYAANLELSEKRAD
ncbi:MAG: cobalamin-binding protein [Chloroherpetonaceae bacterium]|nr:cobalamin-binding protein [Chloroherpetonaceae bacterium]MDW8437893.1 cobalamin-binding protein [Chloroherpetonaceae bacterium]